MHLRREGEREMAKCVEGPNGIPYGTRRGPGISLAAATGTNGLNFIFCNTSVPHRAVFFTGTHAPAIYFVVIFLGLTFRAAPSSARTHTHTHARTYEAHNSHSLFVRRLPLAILVTLSLEHVRTRAVLAPADFCQLWDVITQQSGLFRAYSSADR